MTLFKPKTPSVISYIIQILTIGHERMDSIKSTSARPGTSFRSKPRMTAIKWGKFRDRSTDVIQQHTPCS
jgi:hypothetical protein